MSSIGIGSTGSSSTAHFQLVLPRDHRFGIDSLPIGICYAGTGDHGYGRRRLLTAVPLSQSISYWFNSTRKSILWF